VAVNFVLLHYLLVH